MKGNEGPRKLARARQVLRNPSHRTAFGVHLSARKAAERSSRETPAIPFPPDQVAEAGAVFQLLEDLETSARSHIPLRSDRSQPNHAKRRVAWAGCQPWLSNR